MEQQADSHEGFFHKYVKTDLTWEEANKAAVEILETPWVKQISVFSEQIIFLIELRSLKYLFVSDAAKTILGHDVKLFTGAQFMISLMTPEEVQVSLNISRAILPKLMALNLPPSQLQRVRATWNNWFKHKDGREINLLQHNFILLNEEGMPLLQITIGSDITEFNNKKEHFYKVVLMNEDGKDELLFSGQVDNQETLISPREYDILKGISQGLSSESIAARLDIGIETIKSHRKSLLRKTNSKDTIDLLRFGFANGWL